MTRLQKCLLAGTIAATLVMLGPLQSLATDNTAVAINTRDGSSIFRLAFNVHRLMTDVVDPTNAAVAYSTCEDCRTVAVAIQLVLILSDPDIVSPENYAIAINNQCHLCTTMASAYQYVLTTGGPVRFDAEGNREIAAIRNAIRQLLGNEDLTVQEVDRELDGLVQRLYSVVTDHMLPAGSAGEHVEPTSGVPGDSGQPSQPSPSSTPADTDEPTGSPSPEPGPSQSNDIEPASPVPSPS